MSSAILYGAIVVIWAAVLIPRWLRRGEPVAPAAPEEAPLAGEPAAPDAPAAADARTTADSRAAPDVPTAGAPRREPQRDPTERSRVIGARRRLLGMLVALAFGAGVLAVTGLAAWWVIVPPSVMLAGYLALLREASKADAERRSLQRARTASRGAVADGVPAVARSEAAPTVARSEAVPAVARSEAAPVAANAEVIDITGRVGEEFYDQYADAKLRAVGD